MNNLQFVDTSSWVGEVEFGMPVQRGVFYKVGDTVADWAATPVYSGPYYEPGHIGETFSVNITESWYNYQQQECHNGCHKCTYYGTSENGVNYSGK